MKKFIPIEKQSKKAQKAFCKAHRTLVTMNTGTRSMKTAKQPTRAMQRARDRREMSE